MDACHVHDDGAGGDGEHLVVVEEVMTQAPRQGSLSIVGSYDDHRSIAMMVAAASEQSTTTTDHHAKTPPTTPTDHFTKTTAPTDRYTNALVTSPTDRFTKTQSERYTKVPTTPPHSPPSHHHSINSNPPVYRKEHSVTAPYAVNVTPILEELQHASDMSTSEHSITASHHSADSGTSSVQVDFTDIGEESYNFTTSTLRKCKIQVLKPYWGLLIFIGWRSFRHDMMMPRSWRLRAVNLAYPVLIILLLLYTYMYEMIACEWKLNITKDVDIVTPPPHSTTTEHSNSTAASVITASALGPAIAVTTHLPPKHDDAEAKACEHIVTTYLIPNILHFIAYVMGLYYFRIQDSEQMYALMEKVFLQAFPLQSGSNSQQKLVKKTRLFLLFGSVWVFLTLCLQGLYVWAFDFPKLNIFEKYGQVFHWVMFSVELLGRIIFNSVVLAVVINYVTQCEMVMFYVKGLVLRLQEKSADMKQAFKDILLLRQSLSLLNGIISNMTSMVLVILAELTIIGLSILALNRYNIAKVWAYRGIFPIMWGVMLGFPLFQAGRVNSVCQRLKKISLEMRVFGYKSSSQLELDSFLSFVHNTRLKAKLFHIPILPSYLIALIILVAFIFLILIQTSRLGTGINVF